MHIHVHIVIHTHTHTYTPTHAHTHAHTHTVTHTQQTHHAHVEILLPVVHNNMDIDKKIVSQIFSCILVSHCNSLIKFYDKCIICQLLSHVTVISLWIVNNNPILKADTTGLTSDDL